MTNAKDSTMTGANGKDKARRFAEVTTPIWLIDRQLDLLPKSAFALDKTVLDPCTGDGRYLMRYVLRRINHIKTQDDLIQAFSTLYGYDLQDCNVTRARDNMQRLAKMIAKLKGFYLSDKTIKEVMANNITQKDFINAHQN